jgi:glycerol uptake facilitator-like aquaporin
MDPMKNYLSEFIGTSFLLMIVVGSGIMGQNLSNDNSIILLANTVATGSGLIVLIWMMGSISGAHFNPAVSMIFYFKKQLSGKDFMVYSLSQILGALCGTLLANFMFGLEIYELSQNSRGGINIYISETIATFGLVLVILRVSAYRSELVAPAVGLYITSAYWFTSSTSFANPAVTIGRMFSDTFTGIDPANVIFFILFQLIGAYLAFKINNILSEA